MASDEILQSGDDVRVPCGRDLEQFPRRWLWIVLVEMSKEGGVGKVLEA